jgi:hypothetical protein
MGRSSISHTISTAPLPTIAAASVCAFSLNVLGAMLETRLFSFLSFIRHKRSPLEVPALFYVTNLYSR